MPLRFQDDFLKKLEYLHVVSRREFAGQNRADRRTPKRGRGIEFADHRAYTPGDDFRLVDWKAYKRLGRLLLRLFDEEQDLPIYLILDGQKERGEALIQKAQFDPSMAYNYACFYAAQGKDELALKYLHRHFYGYEKYDDVRRFEMAEARMDLHFKKYKEDPRFLEMTALAAK